VRWAAVDWLKAAAIVAVILTHSSPCEFDGPHAEVDRAVRFTVVGFHVPAFMLLAGYVGSSAAPLGWRAIGSRASRILGPWHRPDPITPARTIPADGFRVLTEKT
jgi:fucose 4-O-acetylase-like acetyltransferase